MNDNIAVIDESNAQALLIEESFQRPVLIDFWADWCAPCKTLMPLLERLASEYAGAFLLAKVNCDEQQMIASQFGVRSLPTLVIMKDGQPVDGFAGAQPESALREFLEKHLPKPWDALLEQARELLADGNAGAALAPLQQACEASRDRPDIVMELATALIALNRHDDAEAALARVRLADQDARYQGLVAQIELSRKAAKAPEIESLEARYRESPDDLEIAYQLALQYSQHQYHREALELLVGILRTDRGFQEGAARQTLLDILASLGSRDPLATEYRRKLYALLY